MQELTIVNIEARLEQLTIFELRQTARAVGVERPAAGKIAEVREWIIAIANGTAIPVPREKKMGTKFADKKLVNDILAYRKSKIGK